MAREIVPQLGGRNCVYTYMGWSLITAPDSLQYKLRADAGENYDAEGFAVIEGRYVIACTEAFGGVGDYVDFQLDTGLILNCIIGDVKSSGDPNYSEWGHLYPPNSISVIESVVEYSKWYPSHANPGTPGCKPEWAGNVVLALNYGNYWEIDPPGGIDMASVIIISATKKGGVENAYIGTIGNDGYIYFNDIDFYRFKNVGTWEDNVYVLNRTRRSWTKTTMFTKISAQNLNSGSGSVAPGGSGVEGACLWAVGIAGDNSHGYDQPTRDGGVDFDCSSLVSWAFRENGWDVPFPSPSTYNMSSVFTGLGFKRYDGNPAASDLVRGDIVLFEGDISAGTGHVELYLGDGMLVGAHINEFGGVAGGQPGDQTGNEISTGGYYRSWNCWLRWEG